MNVVKNYYKSLDFCIITPYDGQRAAISGRLEAENLPWECVYNVDSFQGTYLFHHFFPSASLNGHTSLSTPRPRSRICYSIYRSNHPCRIPQVTQSHERHAHEMHDGDGARDQP